MAEPEAWNPETIIRAMQSDCLHEAERLEERLKEVTLRLREEDRFSALGAWSGTQEIVSYLDAALKRLARLS
jgi:hypothetical protein